MNLEIYNKDGTINHQELEKLVYDYPTKYEKGFIAQETKELISNFPNINMDKFFDAMVGNTGLIEEGNFITYHCDIYHGILCGLENRSLTIDEWD